MRITTLSIIAAAAALGQQPAVAQLEPYKDYDVAEATSFVTTVRVQANMLDYYLEGLKETWVASNEVAKKLGQIEGYNVYTSALPGSGDFNLVLVVHYKNTADLGPSRARYEAFMREWGEQRNQESRETAQTYPNLREITGDYVMNEITFTSSSPQR
jgi:hypothetical protein